MAKIQAKVKILLKLGCHCLSLKKKLHYKIRRKLISYYYRKCWKDRFKQRKNKQKIVIYFIGPPTDKDLVYKGTLFCLLNIFLIYNFLLKTIIPDQAQLICDSLTKEAISIPLMDLAILEFQEYSIIGLLKSILGNNSRPRGFPDIAFGIER